MTIESQYDLVLVTAPLSVDPVEALLIGVRQRRAEGWKDAELHSLVRVDSEGMWMITYRVAGHAEARYDCKTCKDVRAVAPDGEPCPDCAAKYVFGLDPTEWRLVEEAGVLVEDEEV